MAHSSTQKMKRPGIFETLLHVYQTMWHHILEQLNICFSRSCDLQVGSKFNHTILIS